MSKLNENKDFLKRLNYPRQSYALSGIDWGDASLVQVRSKLTIVGAPVFISSIPPGVSAGSDELWQQTYGASMDSYLTLLEGSSLNTNIQAVDVLTTSPLKKSIGHAKNLSLYEKVLSTQQIQYIASKQTVEEAREADDAGGVDEVRSLGVRLPIQGAGWGRTTMFRPTDPEPLDPRENDPEHKLDRSSWKVGPVDTPWDDRLKCFRTFNDLIINDRTYATGAFTPSPTPVFSTNPDQERGFPFLKGFLEDVWKVRCLDSSAPVSSVQNKDNVYTRFDGGKVCTTMAHNLYDPARGGAAPLSDIFTAHGGEIVTCGDENTLVGGLLEILASAFFHLSDTVHGPLNLTANELGTTEVAGELKFIDGVFSPVVPDSSKVNPCSNPAYVNHMGILIQNSQRVIEDGVFSLQDFVCNWNENYTKCILEFLGWNAGNIRSIQQWLNYALPNILKLLANSVASQVLDSVANLLASLIGNIEAAMLLYSAQISNCFQVNELPACDLEFSISAPELIPVVIEVPTIEVPCQTPPGGCQIQSFATWQSVNDRFLDVEIINPCAGLKAFTASCTDNNTPGGSPVRIVEGESYGGTDEDGTINLGGVVGPIISWCAKGDFLNP